MTRIPVFIRQKSNLTSSILERKWQRLKLFCFVFSLVTAIFYFAVPLKTLANSIASINAVQTSQEEGNTVVFVIRLASTSAELVSININYTIEGEFLQQNLSELPASLIIPANQNSIDLRLPTVNDSDYEVDGSVTVTISGDFTTPSGKNSDKVTITDNDMPNGISITPVQSTITEGADVQFQLTTSSISLSDQEIDLTITETGSFITGQLPESIQIDALNRKAILSIPTNDDQLDETEGLITASIDDNSSYTVATAPNNSASVNVLDNDGDPPIVSVSKISPGAVVEGSPAIFRITASYIVTKQTTINFELTEIGDFLLPNQGNTINLEQGNYSKIKEIATIPDDIFEAHGSVQMKILPGDDYQVSSTSYSISIPILDNDTPTGISVAPISRNIDEGEKAQFQIRSFLPLLSDLEVNYTLSTFDGYNTTTENSTATIARQKSATFVEIDTQNQIDNPSYTVTLTLKSGASYSLTPIVSNRSTVVNIQDDDPTPQLSVSPIVAQITEGRIARFLISGPGLAAIHPQINYDLSQTGNFLENTTGGTVQFETGRSDSIVNVPTIDDEIYEANGQVTLTLQDNSEYTIKNSGRTATITVTSDDLEPILSIKALSNTIIEGENAEFMINATTAPSSNMPVNVVVSQGLSDFISGSIPTSTTILASKKSTTLAIPTADDSYPEADGEITVSIAEGANYSFNVLTSQVNIKVRNNDNVPRISIAADSEFITEGSSAEFTLTASSAVATVTTVLLDVKQVSNFIDGAKPTSHQIPQNDTTSTLSISTDNDTTFEPDGSLIITVLNGVGYLKDETNHTAEMQVRDDDNTPGISIIATTDMIKEGGTARFQLKSSPIPSLAKSLVKFSYSIHRNWIYKSTQPQHSTAHWSR